MNTHPVLVEGLRRLGIAATAGQLRQLEGHRRELERWNRSFGFVKAEGEELVVRHFLDCLAGLGVIAQVAARGRIVDVGSGAGFPGIPLAIMLPEATLTLVEPARRKAAFLRNVAILLELANVTVAEKQLREVQGPFDLVTLRAFRPLTRGELAALRRLLAPGGTLVAYKGRRERIEEELREVHLSAPEEAVVVALQVPFLQEERHLVILRSAEPSGSTAS